MTTTVLALPLAIVDDHRAIDRVTAAALHLALWTATEEHRVDELVRAADGSARILLLALARFERSFAAEPSTVVADAAAHLRQALASLD